MKQYLKLSVQLIAAAALIAGTANAGSSSNQKTSVWTSGSNTYGNGTFRPTRESSSSTEYIGCSVYSYSSGTKSVTCYAKDAQGDYANCHTNNQVMVDTAQNLNSHSYLYFGSDANGECTHVITVSGSYNL
jgi:hypothetical protein